MPLGTLKETPGGRSDAIITLGIITIKAVNKMLFPIPLILLMTPVLANVEKTIFKGPAGLTIPNYPPNIEDLYLIPVSPLHPSVRTHINTTFPTVEAPKGTETWMLLDGLVPGARYEVRICWLATVKSF